MNRMLKLQSAKMIQQLKKAMCGVVHFFLKDASCSLFVRGEKAEYLS